MKCRWFCKVKHRRNPKMENMVADVIFLCRKDPDFKKLLINRGFGTVESAIDIILSNSHMAKHMYLRGKVDSEWVLFFKGITLYWGSGSYYNTLGFQRRLYLPLFKILSKYGIIHEITGNFKPSGKGWASRYLLDDRFLSITVSDIFYEEKDSTVKTTNSKNKPVELPIKFLDDKVGAVGYASYLEDLKLIDTYNSILDTLNITYIPTQREEGDISPPYSVPPKRVEILNKKYYRKYVYNKERNYISWGLMYCAGIQCLSKKERKTIEINGLKTTELDFVAMYPSMAYALSQLNVPEKVYLFAPVERKLCKMMLNYHMSSPDKRAIFYAIQKDWYDYAKKSGFNTSLTEYLASCDLTYEQLYDKMLSEHKPISKYLAGNLRGEIESNQECLVSEIQENLMREGLVGLDIHDSFVTPVIHAAQVRKFMNKIYRQQYHFKVGIE